MNTKKPWILLALCLAALIINIDVTIVNVALPSLVRELGATNTKLQWVVDAYTLVFASLILAAGSLSDRMGRKGTLIAGLAVFGFGSLAGALCTTANQLIAARVVMGTGAAAIFPSTLSLIANIFTERKERAQAIGRWGATTGVGVAAGPIVGGWLLEQFWWGSVFLFMLPVAAVVAALVAWAVPTSRDAAAPPGDARGRALSTAGMALLVFGIIQAPNWGWSSAPTFVTIAAGLGTLALFVHVESRIARPMLDVSLFHNARFTAASGSITIAFFTLTGFSFLITQYFQFVKSYSPFATGVRLLPVAVSIAVAAVVGTKLAVRLGNKAVVRRGLGALRCRAPLDRGQFRVDLGRHARRADDRRGQRRGADHRAGHRGDHGCRSDGEGRDRFGDQRRDATVRRSARCRGHRQHRGVVVRRPADVSTPARALTGGATRSQGIVGRGARGRAAPRACRPRECGPGPER